MITIDSQTLFSSGPCQLTPGSWKRELIRRGFPNLNGELCIDMGKRSRTLTQSGRLQASSLSELNSTIAGIEALIDGNTHSLTDNYNRIFSNLIVEEFELQTPIHKGNQYFCDYKIVYRQLG